MQLPSNRVATAALLALGMAVIVIALLWPGVHGGFIFDDIPNLVGDPDWKVRSLDPARLSKALSAGLASGTTRPLAVLSFAINHYFSGMDPFPLKVTGLALHLLNSLLVFVLCRRLFSMAATVENRDWRLGSVAAAATALGWAVHPLQASTVFYVIQRMEIGAATGILAALLCYIAARRPRPGASRSERLGWFAASLAAWLFGLGFKQTALLTPLYCLLLEVFLLRFTDAAGQRQRWLTHAYQLGVAAALMAFVLKIAPDAWQQYGARDFTPVERLLTQARVLVMYLGQIVLPAPDRFRFYYDDFPISHGLLDPWTTVASVVLLAALASTAIAVRRRMPLVGFGIAWFFASHALTSNIIPLEVAFEHRNYLALLGILVAVVGLCARVLARLTTEARATIMALPLLYLGLIGTLEARVWANPVRLATTLESRSPGSVRASYEFGRMMYLFSSDDRNSPAFSIAVREFEHASRLPSSSLLPEQGLIVAMASQGLPVPQRVWQRIDEKLAQRQADPDMLSALHGVLECRISNQCKFDDVRLQETLIHALQANPDSATLYTMYANFAWNVMGDRTLAIELMEQAVQLAPEDAQLQTNLGLFRRAASAASSADAHTLR